MNLHLTTIMKERVGIPDKDFGASEIRIDQLNTIFDKTISRFNSWYEDSFPQRGIKRNEKSCETWETTKRHSPVWLLCGDFNFTEISSEYEYVLRRNFIDTTPPNRRKRTFRNEAGQMVEHNGTKSSGAGNPATLTLDYIFAGPRFIAFDPLFTDTSMDDNKVIHYINSSDHYPIISEIPLDMIR